MNPNESFLSTISTSNTSATTMARIIANVVDTQQHLVSQYQTVVSALESLKLEVRDSTQSLREELRRTDDRAQKQVDDLRVTHVNEVARLMDLVKMLVQAKDQSTNAPQSHSVPPEAPRMTPAQMAYANAAPASNFFGPQTGAFNDLAAQAQAHYAACYLQQLQEQQRMRTAGMQATGFFGNQPGVNMGGIGVPGSFAQSQHAAPVVPPVAATVPKPVATSMNAVPPTTVVAPIPPPNAAFPPTFASTAPSTTSTPLAAPTPSTTSTTSLAPTTGTSSGLFGTAAKPVVTVSLPVSGAVQPPKSEPLKAIPFSFGAPKTTSPATTTSVVSETAKPTTNIFAGIKPTENVFSKTPETKPTIKKEGDGAEDEDHDHVEEFEPQVDFKPVCPLPELVEVVTGEEDEKVIFEERCKLYRFSDDTREWKERGTGSMKVLENTNTKKCRVVMRRDQVFKVCANHQLLPGMTIQVMPRQEKAMMWYCEDFSEDQKSHEKLSARFASVEVANKFKEVFEKAVKNAEGVVSPVKPTKTEKQEDKSKSKGSGDSKEKKAEDKEKSSDSNESVPQKGYGDQFKLQPGQWECPECYSRTDADKCPCCGTSKSGEKAPAPTSKTTLPTSSIPLGGTPSSEGQKFTFGLSAAAAAKAAPAIPTSTPASAPKSSLFGASLATASSGSTPSGGFTFGSKPSIFGGASAKPPTEGSSPLPTFSFAKKPEAAATPNSTAVSSSASPVTFSFKPAGSTSTTPSTGGSLFGSKLFGASSTVTAEEKKDKDKDEKDATTQPKTEQKVFGSGFGGNLSFASLAKSASGSIFDSAHTQKAQAEFAAQAKSKLAVTADHSKSDGKHKEGGEGDGEHGADEEYEPDVQFAPVVPLPDLVDVVTGEEGEEVVFVARAKLFRFVKETKENKERGVGDLKILRNPKTNKYRVVMRREQVHKVCANFAIAPKTELNEKKGMPNVYNWVCRDYSESPDGVDEIFTAKFKTAEIAKEFHDKFMEAVAAVSASKQ
uniref:RanBD1 domain-containing protein n=1 Tax=Haemonchus contortus TaxID=6289 RepID=A0A7I4XYK4_HAECO